MLSTARNSIASIVSQHVEDAAGLRNMRMHLISGPRIKLLDLSRLDERLAAHLDGVAVAGNFGVKLAESALESPDVGAMFVAAIGGIDNKDFNRLDKLFALAPPLPWSQASLVSAFGWVSAQALRSIGASLFGHKEPFRERVAIAASASADPGTVLDVAIESSDVPLRAQALRCAGELGRRDLMSICIDHLYK